MEQLKLVGGGETDIEMVMIALGHQARAAARTLALSSAADRSEALRVAAVTVRARVDEITAANLRDVAEARARNTPAAFLDRLVLDARRIEGIAFGLDTIASLPDPVGRVEAAFDRPNGLRIERVAVPLGVIGVIYESRPGVTADAGALCLKAGNARDPAGRVGKLPLVERDP